MSKLSREQVARATQLAPFRAFAPRDPRLHHFLNKCGGQRCCGRQPRRNWRRAQPTRATVRGCPPGTSSRKLRRRVHQRYTRKSQWTKFFAYYGVRLVDLEGFEPSTSWLPGNHPSYIPSIHHHVLHSLTSIRGVCFRSRVQPFCFPLHTLLAQFSHSTKMTMSPFALIGNAP